MYCCVDCITSYLNFNLDEPSFILSKHYFPDYIHVVCLLSLFNSCPYHALFIVQFSLNVLTVHILFVPYCLAHKSAHKITLFCITFVSSVLAYFVLAFIFFFHISTLSLRIFHLIVLLFSCIVCACFFYFFIFFFSFSTYTTHFCIFSYCRNSSHYLIYSSVL